MEPEFESTPVPEGLMRVASRRVDGLLQYGHLVDWNLLLMLRSAYLQGMKDMLQVCEHLEQQKD